MAVASTRAHLPEDMLLGHLDTIELHGWASLSKSPVQGYRAIAAVTVEVGEQYTGEFFDL